MDLEIIKIASNTKNHKFIENHTHISKIKNPVCGDEMEITLKIKNKKITDFGYQCKSCIYCQASVSLLSRKVVNKEISNINKLIDIVEIFFNSKKNTFPPKWKVFEKLFNINNISRKECLLLPFKALSTVIKKING
jgi:nitrogen fixation NifU-like protein